MPAMAALSLLRRDGALQSISPVHFADGSSFNPEPKATAPANAVAVGAGLNEATKLRIGRNRQTRYNPQSLSTGQS